MPAYEGLPYGEDKNVVVVEVGSAYTKCGLAGETGPRCIIPSEVTNSRTKKIVKLWSFHSSEELYENLKDFFYILFFRHLLASPKDRRLVVLESILCPSDFRETLARLLYTHYEVGSVLYLPCQLASLLTIGSSTGLVIDVGYRETVIIPVYDGIPILKALQSIPLAGKAIHSQIEAQLLETGTITTERNEEKPVSSLPECLTPKLIEDCKVQCCFVTEFSRGRDIQAVIMRGADANKLPLPPPGVDFPTTNNRILHIPGKIREHSSEVLFQLDCDEQSIASLVLDALVQCPIDTRRELAENVVVLGGTSMLPGFMPRLRNELYDLLKQPRYQQNLALKVFRFHQPPALPNYTAWLGGSLIGALETLPSQSLSRDAYLRTNHLPDWCVISQEGTEEKSPVK